MLIVHLFVSYAHVNLCHFFSSSCCQGLAATSACGTPWTFLFTLFNLYVAERDFVVGYSIEENLTRLVRKRKKKSM